MSIYDVSDRLLGSFVLFVALVGLAGCGDSVSPEELAGTFSLTQVNGEPPPRVVATEIPSAGDTTRLSVVDGSVSISSDGSVTVSVSGRKETVTDGSTDTSTDNDTAMGSLQDDDLAFTSDSLDLETEPFAITGGSVSSSVITVSLERTTSPFDVPVNLRFEK